VGVLLTVIILPILMVVQVLLPGHHMAGLREEEEATEIRVQEVEEGCRTAGDRGQITVD
jgi:hypothetical protein